MRFLRDLARSVGLLITAAYGGMMLLSLLLDLGPTDFNGNPHTSTDYVFMVIMGVSLLALAFLAIRFFKRATPKLYWLVVGSMSLPWVCAFAWSAFRSWQLLLIPLIYAVAYGGCYAGYFWAACALPKTKPKT